MINIIIIIIIDLINIRTATYLRQSLSWSTFMLIAASPGVLPFASWLHRL